MLGPQYQAHLKATIKQIAPENYTTELRTLAQTCLSTLTSSLQDRDVSESDNFQLSADALINTSVLSATAPENMARFTAYLCISLVLEQAFLTALGCFTPDNPIWLRVARYSQVFSNRTLSMSPYLTSVANDLNGLNAEEIASPLELLTCAQALSFSYKVSRGDKVCLSPVLRSIQFYAKDGYFIDQNLASFLDMIRNGTCEYCGDRNSDHSFEYAHGEAKITVETTPIDDVTNWTGMQAWNSCKQCELRTESSSLGKLALLHSVGKSLQLLLYAKLRINTCTHTSASRKSRIFNFQCSSDTITTFTYSEIDRYSIVAPRPQKLKYRQDHTDDIEAFFDQLDCFIQSVTLWFHFNPCCHETTEGFIEMKAHIYKDKAAVLDYVRNDHKSTDKRLRILNRFNLIVETVSAWLLFVPTYRQVPIWKFPDYHDQILIPGSNIVIRVDEPSSIIAFCLDLDLSQFDTSIECGGGYKYIASRTGKLGTSLLLPHLLIRINGPNGLDIRCTIYYLDEFESLRSKHCGLPLQSYTNSLARCVKWSPQGGKSKASFYKTKDDTFILKELCKNWTIAEKAQLVKFAPHYINYKAAAQSGTLLALLAGFYALSVKAGIGYTLDVSVMNNLFSGLEIITKYDLKGVATRQSQCESVFHDAEWAHGEYPLIPASKAQLDKCISKDTAFLAQNNIMDYSLLVGTCRDTRQLALGIVDFIGSFTFYKLVETTSKLIRNSNPTIIRPDLYKERFQHAIRGYFQSTPDNSLTYIDKLPSPL